MYRHRRDSTSHLIPLKYPVVQVKEALNDNTLAINGNSTLTGITEETHPDFLTTIFNYTNGNALVGSIYLGKIFNFSSWVYLTNNGENITMDIEDSFQIVINTSTNELILRRLIYSNQYEDTKIPFTVNLNEWFYLTVNRYYNMLEITKNLITKTTISNYYYDIKNGLVRFGKNLTGKLCNTFLSTDNKPVVNAFSDLDAIKEELNRLSKKSENSEIKILDLHDQEIVSCSNIFPSRGGDTYYRPFDQYWRVVKSSQNNSFRTNKQGLSIIPPQYIHLTYPFTIELIFYLDNRTTNIVIASQWQSTNNRSWCLYYDKNTNDIKLLVFNKNNATIQNLTLGKYIINQINSVCIIASLNNIEVYLNGELKHTLALSLVRLHRWDFNYDNNLVSNTGDSYQLHRFTVSQGRKYIDKYLPYKSTTLFKYIPNKSNIHNYHFTDETYHNKRKSKIEFEIAGNSTISPNTTQTYTIILKNKSNTNTTINLSLLLQDKTDILISDITIPETVTVLAGNLTSTFSIQMDGFAKNPYKNRFSILGTSFNSFAIKEINVIDNRPFNLDYITTLEGYLEGYLSKFSVSNGIIPNLENNKTATTLTNKINTLHGDGFLINDVTDVITFPEIINIRTAILVYRELNNQSGRGYFGHSSLNTFNGGEQQQLIGNLVLSSGEYIKALGILHKSSVVKISENDSMFVVIDEASYKVFVYEKTGGVWSENPIELSLDISDTTVLVNSSIDINTNGTVLALGFQNANNGEGLVQIWKKQNSTWVKDLHLGSPIPYPYLGGFGHSVAVNDAGDRLFVSQIGNDSVYIFEKNSVWNPVPVETLIGADRFGYSISCNNSGDLLFINEVDTDTSYIYKLNNYWTLHQTITFGKNGQLNRLGNFLAISDFSSNTVKLFDYSSVFTEIKTLTGSGNFGYSVDVSNNKDVLISNPSEHEVYHLLNINSYNSSTVYTSPLLENVDYYGYSCSVNSSSLVVSNFFNNVELITNNSMSLPSSVVGVRQNYAEASLEDILINTEPQILTFYTSLPLTINNIGKTKTNLTLNGIVYGWLFFNRILTSSEINDIELLLKQFLALNTYSLYDT